MNLFVGPLGDLAQLRSGVSRRVVIPDPYQSWTDLLERFTLHLGRSSSPRMSQCDDKRRGGRV